MRGLFTILAGMGLACVLAAAASTAEQRHVFHVTLNATVTKLWSATTRATRDGCPTSTRFQGRDSVMFRSSRPTTIVVTFGGGRVTYTPRAVRSLDLVVDHRGTRTVTTAAPCQPRTVNTRCGRGQRTIRGRTATFTRSGKNEITFSHAALPFASSSCPGETAQVRAIRPDLHVAQGEVSEAALARPRSAQTALGSFEQTTILEGNETGSVVERVHWALTFTPAA